MRKYNQKNDSLAPGHSLVIDSFKIFVHFFFHLLCKITPVSLRQPLNLRDVIVKQCPGCLRDLSCTMSAMSNLSSHTCAAICSATVSPRIHPSLQLATAGERARPDPVRGLPRHSVQEWKRYATWYKWHFLLVLYCCRVDTLVILIAHPCNIMWHRNFLKIMD